MKKLDNAMIYGEMPDRVQSVIANALRTEETPMKKKSMGTLLLAAILIIALAGVAVAAVTLSRSAQSDAAATAKKILLAEYGLSPEALGLFEEVKQEDGGGGWTVRYVPTDFAQRLGTYEVTLPAGETGTATWTHDGVDLDRLAKANMDGPVWGAAQIAQYQALFTEYMQQQQAKYAAFGPSMTWTMQARAELDAIYLAEPSLREMMTLNILPGADDLTEAQALVLAQEAITQKYGVDAQALAAYEAHPAFLLPPAADVGHYDIYFYLPDPEDENISQDSFYVQLSPSPGAQAVRCDWHMSSTGMTLPDGPLDAFPELVERYVRSGAFFLLNDQAQKQDIARRITEAGFGDLIGGGDYGAAEGSRLTPEEAEAAARAEVGRKYGLTEEMLGLFTAGISFRVDGESPSWRVLLVPDMQQTHMLDLFEEKLGHYQVSILDESGEVAGVVWSHDGTQAAQPVARDNFGAAEAWDAKAVAWFMEFRKEQLAMVRAAQEIDPDGTMPAAFTWESMAAYDQLFRDAGFDARYFPYGVPGEGEVSYAQACALLEEALLEEYGMTAQECSAYTVAPAFVVSDPEKPVWQFNVFTQTSEDSYYVQFDGRSGELLDCSYYFSGNG